LGPLVHVFYLFSRPLSRRLLLEICWNISRDDFQDRKVVEEEVSDGKKPDEKL